MQLIQHINALNGDFNYNAPLGLISGATNEEFTFHINYNAGIEVDKEASWVGLGFSLDAGEISRRVIGQPDDYKNQTITTKTYKATSSDADYLYNISTGEQTATANTITTNYYGSVYYKDYPTSLPIPTTNQNINMDVVIDVDRDAQVTTLPGYDEYYINTAAISGKMNMGLFSLGSLVPSVSQYNTDVTYEKKYDAAQRPEFICSDEYINAPVIKNDLYDGSVAKGYEQDVSWGPDQVVTSLEQDFFRLETIEFNSIHTENCNPSNERLCTKKYVEYFTNSQLDGIAISSLPGFMEYSEPEDNTVERPSGSHPADAIGAIRIIDETGMVYHFSLPVYVLKEESYDFHLDADYKIGTTVNDSLVVTTNNNKYALSWKLTAITGPDYVDANSNAYPDEADKGYWIRFDYSKWGEIEDRFPAYGLSYNADYTSENSTDCTICRTDFQSYSYAVSNYNRGFYSIKQQEVYYLEKVMTSTQSLYFFKEVRKDIGKSNVAGTTDKFPTLALKRIALIENKHNPESLLSSSTSGMEKHGFAAPDNYNKAMFDYQFGNSADFRNKCLSAVEFNYDYSLCNRYYGNVATTVTDPDFMKQSCIDYAYAHGSGTGLNNASLSGKLTLKSIQSYDYQCTRNRSATKFEYGYNPDYPYYVSMRDFWGYYKSDGPVKDHPSARYTTPTSGSNADAWSLTKIILPTKAEMLIEYESDRYKVEEDVAVRVKEDNVNYLCEDYEVSNESVKEVGSTQVPNFLTGIYADKLNAFQHTDSFYILPITTMMGGGLRVSKISLKETASDKTYSLKYTYENGIATNVPYKYAVRSNYFANPDWSTLNNLTPGVPNQMGHTLNYLVPKSSFNTGINTYIDPMVGYGDVKVTVLDFDNTDGDLGYKKYTFYNDWKSFGVYKSVEGMYLYTVGEYDYEDASSGGDRPCVPSIYPKFVHSVNYAIFSDKYGKLKKTELYDKYNNLISATKYLYQSRKIEDVYHVGFSAVGEKTYKYYSTFVNIITPNDIKYSNLGVFVNNESSASEPQKFKTHISHALDKVSTLYSTLSELTGSNVYSGTNAFSQISMALNDARSALSSALATGCPCEEPIGAPSVTQTALHDLGLINSSNYTSKLDEVNIVMNALQNIMSNCFETVDGIPGGTPYTANYNLVNISGQMIIPECNNGNSTVTEYAAYNVISRESSRLAAVYTYENGTVRNDSSIYDPYGLVSTSVSVTGGDKTTKTFTYAYGTHSALDLKAKNSSYTNRVSMAKSASATPGFTETMDYVSQIPRVVWNDGYSTETANLWTVSKTYHEGKLNGGISLYNSRNKPIESYDVLNRFTSQKYGYDDKYIISSASNSTYSESAHTSFEDDVITGATKKSVGGEVYILDAADIIDASSITNFSAHTGLKVLQIAPSETGIKYTATVLPGYKPSGSISNYGKLVENKDYAIYVWASKLTSSTDLKLKVSIASGGSPSTIVNGGEVILETPQWKLHKIVFKIPSQSSGKTVTIEVNNDGGGIVYVDDFRLQPASGSLQAFVYDNFTGLVTHTLNDNNMYIRKEYDSDGRVLKEFAETKNGEKLLKEYQYNTPID